MPDERPVVERPPRPDWLWEKDTNGSWEYWTRESVIYRDYIDWLENQLCLENVR